MSAAVKPTRQDCAQIISQSFTLDSVAANRNVAKLPELINRRGDNDVPAACPQSQPVQR